MDMVKRKELNRALAKAIAFKDHGNLTEARVWADKLIALATAEFKGGNARATVAASDAATG